jgi:hypothetical protein
MGMRHRHHPLRIFLFILRIHHAHAGRLYSTDCTLQYGAGGYLAPRGWRLAVGRWPLQVGGDASHHSTEGSSRHLMRVLNSKIIPKRKKSAEAARGLPCSVTPYPVSRTVSKYIFAFGSAAAHHGVAP